MPVALLAGFVGLQIVQNILFKLGSGHADWSQAWWKYFLVATGIGVVATFILMTLYRFWNANLAYGLAVGFSFLSCQIALAVMEQHKPTALQWAAVVIISLSMIVFMLTGAKPASHG
jgi:hypothetical protein